MDGENNIVVVKEENNSLDLEKVDEEFPSSSHKGDNVQLSKEEALFEAEKKFFKLVKQLNSLGNGNTKHDESLIIKFLTKKET